MLRPYRACLPEPYYTLAGSLLRRRSFLLPLHDDIHAGLQVADQADGDRVDARPADGLADLDLAPIDLYAQFRLDLLRDVGAGDGAKEDVLFAHLGAEVEGGVVELFGHDL